MTALFSVAALTVVVSSMCSLFEAILYSTRMGALEAERASGAHAGLAERFIAMRSNIAQPTSAILILNTLANTAGATICGMYAASVFGPIGVVGFSVGLTVAILFVGEILPKTYGATHWRTTWRRIVWPLALMQWTLSPLIRVTQAFAYFFTGRRTVPSITEEEIMANIQMGEKAGEVSASEVQLLSAVFRFDDILVRQVMVPRREVVFLGAHWPLGRCLDVAKQTGHTRFPLCRESLDEAFGILHVKDLLGLRSTDQIDFQAIARPLRHVPETLPIRQLMRDMQSSQQHMALVYDEYGSVVGLITLENVVEQLVGAVQDEFDNDPPDIVAEGAGIFRVNGHLPIAHVNREIGLDLPSDGVDTLSGLVTVQLNRLPAVGDRVKLEGARVEVLAVKGSRASTVRLSLSADATDSLDQGSREAGETH